MAKRPDDELTGGGWECEQPYCNEATVDGGGTSGAKSGAPQA